MKVICYNAASWWYLLEDQGRFFMDFSIENFGTTTSRAVEIRQKDAENPKIKKKLLSKPAVDPKDESRLIPIFETAEYIAATYGPHTSIDDLSDELLQQVQQAIRDFNN